MKEKIEKLIAQMTLDEKLGQLTQEFLTDLRMDEMKEKAEKGEIGSLILANSAMAGANEQESLQLSKLNSIQRAAVEKSRLGIPVINGRDIIHGSRTVFPIPLAQTATWDYELIRDAASVMAEEASKEGVHWTFAPMLDVCCDPRWGRIIECSGEDPYLGCLFAKASVEGIQGSDMSKPGKLAACAKHFIGYGASSGGRDKDATEWSDYSLRNRALPAFRAAVDAGVATVMSSFNEISGQPATASKYHLTDILRHELGFEGFVISDWDAVLRLKCQGVAEDDEASAVLAINAGVDMDMVDCVYKNNIKSAIEKGLVSIERVNDAVRRVLKAKFELGLFENPYFDEDVSNEKIMTCENLQKAKEVSRHSMVLLKNNGILPLKKGEVIVAVMGPYAEEKEALMGSWHAGGRKEDVVSLAEGVTALNGEDKTVSYPCFAEDMWIHSGLSDTYIVALGESHHITGEGTTMVNIEMPWGQIDCAKRAKEMGKKVIAVIFAGRPLGIESLLPWCDAVLWAWHGGTACGTAAAEIIFGDFNPCGKLPVTFPRSTGQIPIQYNHQRNELGLRWYYEQAHYVARNTASTPLFEFGYGLSYTEFEYSDFEFSFNESETIAEISFKIRNTGEFDGWEIAECYVSDVVASAARPIKELKAFEKVFVKKGETKEVVFRLTKDDLSFYDIKGNWVFEPGEFVIEIGKSCKNICRTERMYLNQKGC